MRTITLAYLILMRGVPRTPRDGRMGIGSTPSTRSDPHSFSTVSTVLCQPAKGREMPAIREAKEFVDTIDFGVLAVREDELEAVARRCRAVAVRELIVV